MAPGMAGPSSWIRGKLLGAGAFGSVSLAMQREGGAVFAAKSVVVEANSGGAVRAIENEIGLLQALDSEFVVRCLGSDWTEENGHMMRNVFLEYMPEGCLTDFLNQFARAGALDEHLIRTYTRSIVEGIEYLHDHDVVHCDVKGKNILVGNGHVKLTDFGSAKRVAEDGSCSKARGTPLWMAPEVVRQVEQGPASDIWSLGCTVLEMATGRAPWRNLAGMNQFAALFHIGCTDDLPPVPAWLSPDAHDFLAHCFQRDPRKRWTSSQLLQHRFLTTRFTPEPQSPTSAIQFPADDDCDIHYNSVPTLAAPPPSLLTRNLVSAEPARLQQVQSEQNWWNSPACSGPWIVVRSLPGSPKTSATFTSECIKPISGSDTPLQCEDSETSGAGLVEKTPVTFIDADSRVVAATSNGDNSSFFVSVATTMDFACCALDLDCVQVKLEENPSRENFQVDREFLAGSAISLGLVSGKMCTCSSEYSVVVHQCCNPQILLCWWHYCRKRRLRRDLENCWNCGIQSQNEYGLALDFQITPASLEIVCEYAFVFSSDKVCAFVSHGCHV